MSHQEHDTAGAARPKTKRFLPHLGALIAGGAALWGWFQLVATDRLDSDLIWLAYLVILMVAPVAGAGAVAYMQRTASQEERIQVVVPYMWWAAVGLIGLLLYLVSGTRARYDGATPPVVRVAFLSVFVLMWLVPVVVPLLRMIMWIVSPPAIETHERKVSYRVDQGSQRWVAGRPSRFHSPRSSGRSLDSTPRRLAYL
jgi:hypothetical protein